MGQGGRILFRVLTSSNLEYLRGGREAFAYGEGQGVEDKSFSSVETSSSDLEYRQSNYTEAEEFARLAKDKAVEMGLNTEASQAQKGLDFLSVITSGHTIDNGPQQSESEGENADISSSEADSDWLTAILN